MTAAARGRRHAEKAGSTTHDRTHRRPGSFTGVPDGDKGERANGSRQPGNTQQTGAEDKRKGGERDTDGIAPGERNRRHGTHGRHNRQTEEREKEYVIYLRERRREKTPLRLAKACKYAYIHITQYRSVLAMYCTFFYIYRGILYIFIYILSRLMFTFLLKLMVFRYIIIIYG